MCAIHSLQVHLRVPVRVKENNNVSGGEIDTKTTGASRQHEDKLTAALGVIRINRFLKREGQNKGVVRIAEQLYPEDGVQLRGGEVVSN